MAGGRQDIDAAAQSACLGEVRVTLLRVAERLSSLEETPPPISTQNTNPSPAACVSASVAAEQRRLISYRNNAKRARSSGSSLPKSKRNATCTLKFVCLAAKEEVERPPISVKERTALANAGFGDTSITFGYNKSSVYNGIIQRFPQLSEVGGFYLLLFQGGIGEDAGFHRILPPRTPQRLKELCGQAKIFMRPVQKDIELDDKSGEERDADSDVPMINCFTCGAAIMMTDMQQHQETHQEGETKQPEDVFEFSADNDSNWEPPIMLQSSQPQKQQQDKALVRGKHQESCSGEGCSNSCSASDISAVPTQIDHLSEMFPDKSRDFLKACLQVEGSFNQAVMSLLQATSKTILDDDKNDSMNSPSETVETCGDTQDLSAELRNLQKNFSSDQKEKVKVDEEDILNDAMAYYKGQDFDPRKRLRIIYRGQAAADTGGVIRQFYAQLLSKISDAFFQGYTYRSPVYNCDIVASGVMKLVGTIIVHSVLQGGPGFPVFSPGVYNYLAKGDLNEVMEGVSIKDCSYQMEHFITKIAKVEDVSELDKDEIASVLSDCGLSMTLSNDNKMRVIQSLIIHDAIGKPKILLDQLRQGLHTLEFGSRMQLHPQLFKELFVAGEKEIQGSDVKGILMFPSEMSDAEKDIMEHMTKFILGATPDVLKSFLTFATEAPCLPDFGLGRIRIEFDDVDSILSSTCTKNITLPRNFPDKDTFLVALQAGCDNCGKAFTSI